jgi:phage-related protein
MIKPIVWVGPSNGEFLSLPKAVIREFGHGLYLAQKGDKADFAKPLKGFGNAGVLELRDNHDGETYRAMYTVQFAGTVYVLAAFHKKSKRGIALPKHEQALIQSRLKLAREIHRRGSG